MILSNVRIITTKEVIEQGSIVIEDNLIKEIHHEPLKEGIDLSGLTIMPGFIDIHIHGTRGFDVLEGQDALNQVSIGQAMHGVTTFLPTTLTLGTDTLKSKLRSLSETHGMVEGAKIVGVHLEGPFINKTYKGAQNPDFIKGATIEGFKELNDAANGFIKLVSYAPERTTTAFTEYCSNQHIITSVAHSNATFKEIEKHYEYGLKSLTHYHNAQSGHHHRKPGVVTAGFYFDLNAEIICDGLHLDRDVVKTVFKIKGRNEITLISDSMKAANMKNGNYDLGGLDVVKDSSSARLKDGSLAGSILNFNHGVKNFYEFTSCELTDLVYVSSYNQAKLLNLKNQGDIKENYLADLVILDNNFEVIKTIVNGKIVYEDKV